MNAAAKLSRILILFAIVTSPAAADELAVSDFRLDGPLGSDGATIDRIGTNHFRMTLGHAVAHEDWANNCQFEITGGAKGNALVLDVVFGHPEPHYLFDEYYHSWSHDRRTWHPVFWEKKPNGKSNRMVFPEFTEDTVHFGLQTPMSFERAEQLLHRWSEHPDAQLHVLGKSLGGHNVYRLEVTNADAGPPRSRRWVHYFANQHPGEHNAQWRMVGIIQWLLSDARTDLRQRTICHFVLMMSPDAPSKGWYRINGEGVDMNRSYKADGSQSEGQAHEAFVCQRDLEQLMASDAPVTDQWSMHTWGGMVDPILTPGPEFGTAVGSKESLAEILERNDPQGLVDALHYRTDGGGATTWTGGPFRQFGITSVLCEGAGAITTREENIASGVIIMKSLAEFYGGTKP